MFCYSKGIVLTSSYEYPGRYKRWTVGFVSPAIQIEGRSLDFSIKALNDRGVVLIAFIKEYLQKKNDKFSIHDSSTSEIIFGEVIPSSDYFPEEERSKQPSLFSLVRAIQELFSSPDAGQLGLYGALGYDLTFQFETIKLFHEREKSQRDLVMFLPDEIVVVDNQKKSAWKIAYEFSKNSSLDNSLITTDGLPREAVKSPYKAADSDVSFNSRDGDKGKYAESVIRAKEEIRVGNLFEVVLSQTFRERMSSTPSTIFRRYEFFHFIPFNEMLTHLMLTLLTADFVDGILLLTVSS